MQTTFKAMIAPPAHRRRVLFCTGYDPNGPGFFYNLFKREFHRYCDRFDFTGKVSNCHDDDDRVLSHWQVEMEGGGWTGATDYSVMNWDDVVKNYMDRPWWMVLFQKLVCDVDALATGTYWRMCRLNWRFGLACTYPTLAVLVLGLVAAAVGWGVHALASPLAMPVWGGITLAMMMGLVTFVIGYRLLSWKNFLHLLLTDGIFSFRHARGKCKDYNQRVDVFAARLVNAVQTSDHDELLIVGHSSGSFCAVEVLARALRQDPELLQRGPKVGLLTLGANLPLIGCHPRADSFRRDVALVAAQQELFWLEYQATEDLLNFPDFDPIRDLPGISLESPQMNPVVHSACVHQSLSPANYKRFRFNCFRVHFQYLMAIDRLVPCDYMMIVAGPASLEIRGLDPAAAMAICHGPGAWTGTDEELHPLVPLPSDRMPKLPRVKPQFRADLPPESVVQPTPQSSP
ncbi:MAG: hypothetical protein AAGF97_01910 [Planctomycetota bacterium]